VFTWSGARGNDNVHGCLFEGRDHDAEARILMVQLLSFGRFRKSGFLGSRRSAWEEADRFVSSLSGFIISGGPVWLAGSWLPRMWFSCDAWSLRWGLPAARQMANTRFGAGHHSRKGRNHFSIYSVFLGVKTLWGIALLGV